MKKSLLTLGVILLFLGAWYCRFDILSIKSQMVQRFQYRNSGISVIWKRQGDYRFRCALPSDFDLTDSHPLAICFHGAGTDENFFSSASRDRNAQFLADSLLSAGYIVLTASARPYVSTWGAQNGLDAYVAAYNWLKSKHKIGPVVLVGISMGGMEALLTIAQHKIPDIRAAVLNVPACSLKSCYANPTFTRSINNAYNIDNPTNYATQTKLHDPILIPSSAYDVPMLIIAATEDREVIFTENTKQFFQHINGTSQLRVIVRKGGHNASIHAFMKPIMNFLYVHVRG